MADDGENTADFNAAEGDETGPSPEAAEELLSDPGRFAGLIRKHPEVLQNVAAGLQAVREGFSQFLTANDRGANRVQATADKILDSIDEELDRGGLSPDERYRLIEAEQRVLHDVTGNEEEVRKANERSFAKLAAIGLSVAVGVVAVGYLANRGDLPTITPPST